MNRDNILLLPNVAAANMQRIERIIWYKKELHPYGVQFFLLLMYAFSSKLKIISNAR